MADLACPECHSDKVWGNEVRDVYDGVLFWSCAECGAVWPRNFGEGARLTQKSIEYVAKSRRRGD